MGEVGIAYGCGYWGSFTAINWDSDNCSHVLDGDPQTVYGATVSTVALGGGGQAQFGVMARLLFVDLDTENPVNIDGVVRLHSYVWGSPAIASGIVGWGYAHPDGRMAIMEAFGNQYGNSTKEMYLFRLPEYADWYYAVFAQGTGSVGTVSGAAAKIKEIEFVELWYSPAEPPILYPVADFAGYPLQGEAPLVVDFTNLSRYADAFVWLFGDGDHTYDRDPTHTFEGPPGLYDVALIAYNPDGDDEEYKAGYIEVLPPLSPSRRRRRAAGDVMERPRIL